VRGTAPALRHEGLARGLLFCVFFASGFAGLLYQVVWQRVLAIFSGADVYAATMVVATFMLGLGLGSLVGGHLADRVGPGWPIRLFAIAELAIGVFAFVSLRLYYDLLYGRLGHLAAWPGVMAALLALGLLWPTFLMGLSLPLLARGLAQRVASAPTLIGALYAVNTLGASVGAFLTAWVLVGRLGFEAAVQVGALVNAACALGALATASLLPLGEGQDEGCSMSEAPRRKSAPHPIWPCGPFIPLPEGEGTWPEPRGPTSITRHAAGTRIWIAVYALSGFVALSLEIVWFRVLSVMTKASAFTFGHLLAVYLAGLAVGTFLGIARARRSAAPGRELLLAQAAIGGYAVLSLAGLTFGLAGLKAFDWLLAYLRSYRPLSPSDLFAVIARVGGAGGLSEPERALATLVLGLYVLLPLAVVGPPTLLMGMSFPLLQRVVQDDVRWLGRRVGWLQAANILGSTAGAVATGWLMLPLLGTAGTVRLLLIFGAVFLSLWALGLGGRAVRAPGWPRLGLAGGLALGVGAVAPEQASLWAKLHGVLPGQAIVAEDGSGVSVLIASADPVEVFSNGLGQGLIPFAPEHVMLGLLPAMLHPAPTDVAIIGLGSGGTLFGAGGRAETAAITCVEIVGAQQRSLGLLRARGSRPELEPLLADPRVRFVVADGRAVLRFEGRRYDLIEADALRPTSAYAGNLYSVEYFDLLRRHLKDGGLAITWAPTERVERSFVKVFPHALRWQMSATFRLMVGSNEPIPWRPEAVHARLTAPAARAYYRAGRIDVDEAWAAIAAATVLTIGPDLDRSSLTDLNHDLYPRDEYLVPDL
jgi:spermidine synthase